MSESNKSPRLKSQTPGGPVPKKQMPPQEGEAQTDDLVSGLSPDLQKLIQLEKDKAVSLYKKSIGENSEYPPQHEIDAGKIARAVMSEDGWVCPSPPEVSDREMEIMRRIM